MLTFTSTRKGIQERTRNYYMGKNIGIMYRRTYGKVTREGTKIMWELGDVVG